MNPFILLLCQSIMGAYVDINSERETYLMVSGW